MEDIRCAAIMYLDIPGGVHHVTNSECLVVCGYNHPQCITIFGASGGGRTALQKTVQGFLTSCNRFVNREEGARIAFAAGQTQEPKTELYSEDLYRVLTGTPDVG